MPEHHLHDRDLPRAPGPLNRAFASGYDLLMAPLERVFLRRVRQELARSVRGEVLEVGAGTGVMFGYYSASCNVVAAEPDPVMRARAHARLERRRPVASVRIIEDPIEDLRSVPPRSQDFVVSTLVLCSVRNLAHAMREMRRVLKPEGRVVLLEHVRSQRPLVQRFFERANPLWTPLFGGCRLGQDTQQILREGGFLIEEERYILDFVVRFSARLGPEP